MNETLTISTGQVTVSGLTTHILIMFIIFVIILLVGLLIKFCISTTQVIIVRDSSNPTNNDIKTINTKPITAKEVLFNG